QRPRSRARARRGRSTGRCRARQSISGHGARGNRPDVDADTHNVIRVLAAGVVSMVISIIVGPKFIEFLRRNEFGQHIREEGPEHHVDKQGTPVMGGLLILVTASIAFLAVSKYKVPALTVLFVTLACGAIGFLDDFIKLTHKRSLGLNARWKLILLALITVGVAFAAR